MTKLVIRKCRSLYKKVISHLETFQNKLRLFLLEENVHLGKNVTIGKSVRIRTTDGGQITIGPNTDIEKNSYIYAQGGQIVIGNNSFIGCGSQIVAKQSVVLGENCLIAAYSIIRDSNHGISSEQLIRLQDDTIKPVLIESDVWLGAHTTVTAGCKLAEGTVVGANSVVTKDTDKYSIVGGVPAKIIKSRITK